MTKTNEAKATPFMAQYLRIKAENPDTLLFFRMGDFYELFFEDATKAAKALDITLTQRGQHKSDPIPMAGVPHHSAEPYLARLIRLGFRVAICEQTETPAEAKKRGSKAVVNREIVRIVTPGTLTEETLLDARSDNFLCAIVKGRDETVLALADISTGIFRVFSVARAEASSVLAGYGPREIVYADGENAFQDIASLLGQTSTPLTPHTTHRASSDGGKEALKQAFHLGSVDGLGAFSDDEYAAIGLLLSYIELTQAGRPAELDFPKRETITGHMLIDETTRAALEIERTQTGDRKGSLLATIDRTLTGGGARLFAEHLARPLLMSADINQRLDAVQSLYESDEITEDIRAELKTMPDLDRARARLRIGRSGPKDLAIVANSIETGEAVLPLLASEHLERSALLTSLHSAMRSALSSHLSGLKDELRALIVDNPPLTVQEGGVIRAGANARLDELRTLRDNAKRIIAELEANYQAETKISQLKIKFNNMLGYFVEVPSRFAEDLEGQGHVQFHRRQGLANSSRYSTDTLIDLARDIETANDDARALETELFQNCIRAVLDQSEHLKTLGESLAALDVASAGAHWAQEIGACRPELTEDRRFIIEGGRHPVVEAALQKTGEGFVGNDIILDDEAPSGSRLNIITGPNMAGKSTYLRQIAVLAILAQAGWYVPANAMAFGPVDRVFSRVGASDDLAKGKSTFMVEMLETASILNQASDRALVILDEVGRGTSTYDGLAIAWACVEYLHDVIKCRGLFATHYHELTRLAARLPFAENLSLRAREWKGDLIFLHEVQKGPADRSYGVQVAKLAGLPKQAVTRAKQVLDELETAKTDDLITDDMPLFSFSEYSSVMSEEENAVPVNTSDALSLLADIDPNHLSPREALDLVFQLKERLRN